ncbi:MAG: hypothetical protein PHD67_08340 [Oscillospiraceae bacterium]|nr:hypothetical protein [Oscillospiraceae bacterium]
MWRVDHYLTMDYYPVLQSFRRISKQMEDSRDALDVTWNETQFFYAGSGQRMCRVLAYNSFLTVVFPELGAGMDPPGLEEARLRDDLRALAGRARRAVLSAAFSRQGGGRAWLGIFDGEIMADGVWGQQGRRPDFSLLAALAHLDGKEEALEKAWNAQTLPELQLALEAATGLPFGPDEGLGDGYECLEERMIMKVYTPLSPALGRFFYCPHPAKRLEAKFSDQPLVGVAGIHFRREDLDEEDFLVRLRGWGEAQANPVTALIGRDYISVWRQERYPVLPEEVREASRMLHCRILHTVASEERAFSLCAAQNGELTAACGWLDIERGAWGLDLRRWEAWQARMEKLEEGLSEDAVQALCSQFGLSAERLMEAARFGNLPYLMKKLPGILGVSFEIPKNLDRFDETEVFSNGKIYRKPEEEEKH